MRKLVLIGFVSCVLLAFGNGALAQDKKPAPPEPKIKVGDMAPNFSLNDQEGKPVSLKDFRGKKSVALAFAIFAFTGG